MKWKLSIKEQEQLLAWRRDFHQHPELSWEEYRTSEKVVEALQKMGYKPQVHSKTGVVADLGTEGPMVVLRADMDALPIQEATLLSFASLHEGKMHACGHDVHMACLLLVAQRMIQNPPVQGRVRFLFQPAEEGAKGAQVVLEEGLLSDPEILSIYGAHIWSKLPTGVVATQEGALMGSVDVLEIDIVGKGGHAAMPHDTADAIVAGAYLITHLQALVSRKINPLQPFVLSIGQFQAGTAFNVIAQEARLIGTIRTMDMDLWEQIPRLLEETVHSCVQSLGCQATVTLKRQQIPLVNHAEPTRKVLKSAEKWVESDCIQGFQTLAGEDFSSYLQQIPGCFFFVGAGGTLEETIQKAPHHNPSFVLEEDAFDLVVRLMEQVARDTLDNGKIPN